MNDQLRRAALARKLTYLGIILGLFTLSMFWRGKIGLPGGSAAHAAEARYAKQPVRLLDRLAALPIDAQADALEMRELDLGDAEVAGSAARVSLVGFRGVVVTGMWWSAIEKQKRGEYHEFELLARTVTRLQPHFIDPWVFQAWNIAYNVSVENDKLGDMYFYIARGIELLAEGDRLNSRVYRGQGGQVQIGSPDIRYQLGFYYQNKFTVSDKVATLRSLMQLSAMKPSDRDPATFLDAQDRVIPARFRTFCEQNPQLVRRLADKLQCRTPRDVIDFLRTNKKLPTRYKDDGTARRDDLALEDSQFPTLPKAFAGERVEYHPGSDNTDDGFDAMHAARAWYEYAQTVIPPPLEGVPQSSPKAAQAGKDPAPGEYDPFRYRMPARPSLIIFRMQPARSQTYLAERLQKEGWFDAATRWAPADAGLGDWFPGPRAELAAKRNSQAEYATAFDMWDAFGKRNGFLADADTLREWALRAAAFGPVYNLAVEPPADDENYKAALAMSALRTNKQITNFEFFHASTRAERSDELVGARKQLAAAEREKEAGSFAASARQYAKAIAAWRKAVLLFPEYRTNKGNAVNEQTADHELALVALLKDDESVRKRVPPAREAILALVPQAPPDMLTSDWRNALAETEALTRIAMEMENADLDKRVAEKVPSGDDAAKRAARRALIDTDFAWMKRRLGPKPGDDPWVPRETLEAQKVKAGLMRKPPPEPAPPEPAPAH